MKVNYLLQEIKATYKILKNPHLKTKIDYNIMEPRLLKMIHTNHQIGLEIVFLKIIKILTIYSNNKNYKIDFQ